MDDMDEPLGVDDQLGHAAPPEEQSPLLQLTRLLEVPVTAAWPTEPHHFTPWLLHNGPQLAEALGLDIELEDREHKVGKFSLDIIGREVGSGGRVIVENQFGTTDHAHLGQLLTYAGGTEPTTIIWIAEAFREEHRAALEWLNAHTRPEIRFFGVRLAVVMLEGGPSGLYAPLFELVVQPNEWVKDAIGGPGSPGVSGLSAQQTLYLAFWSKFEPIAKARGWTNGTAPAQNWWNLPTGVGTIWWSVSYATFGCRSELYFGHPDPDVNTYRFSQLAARADDLRGYFGDGDLRFDALPNNKGCRIETRLLGPKVTDKNSWDDVLAWMVDTQDRLRAAVMAVGGIPSDLPHL